MITIRQKGDFSKFTRYLKHLSDVIKMDGLYKYGEEGVAALESATPVDTGLTASSWDYEIYRSDERVSISFQNSNINNGVNIAIILQYGHGTRNGGYVEGRDYINPAIQPIFDKMAKAAWEEVTKV